MSKTNNNTQDMIAVAQTCIGIAKSGGANEAAARAYRVRDVSLDWRDGKPEKITEATTRGVVLQLYVDGRFATVSTSDLRPDALKVFINDSIALTRALAVDPFRSLPDPELYKGQAAVDLKIEDPRYSAINADEGRKVARIIHDAARSVKGGDVILSVTSSFSTGLNETWLVTSNGFSGARRDTSFWTGAAVSVKDSDGRRPEDWHYAGARFYSDLPAAEMVGQIAGDRAVGRLGSKKGASAAMMLAVDNRAAGRLAGMLGQALQAGAIQQKRSFLEGKIGQPIASDKMSVTDDPLLLKGFASRRFDNEGIAARQRAMIEDGVLRNYYVDTYYGRKLKLAPTTGSGTNLTWKSGGKNRSELLAEMKDGILVTSFIGGNSNSGTGDFSVGILGHIVRNGVIAEPIAEMNLAGNHLEFWKKLVAVGNDPYAYSTMRTPTLVFENVAIAGA